ncbi:hypothetical protein BJ970_000605 [Saccharopolyspora phatthalungensis]|uniref:Uncharacterized protein n=1 Tax=Saccharopolyspora phatthalungensis TaxID=664693 RepID=A0A840Q0M3_9PSEU|nr:hypothetical protein [Saccharopolyspora phatthalungensis]
MTSGAVLGRVGNGRPEGADFVFVRDWSLVGCRVQLPAAVVCAVLSAVVAFLVGVSLWVPGPPASPGSAPADGIVTAATPTELGSAAGRVLVGQ